MATAAQTKPRTTIHKETTTRAETAYRTSESQVAATKAAAPVSRLGFVYVPMGSAEAYWTPKSTGVGCPGRVERSR